MKRIFFLLYSMGVGGVEKALLGLLSIIPLDKYEVHVGLINKEGGFLNLLPKEVKIHEINCYKKYWQLLNGTPLRAIRELLKKRLFKDALEFPFLYLWLYILHKNAFNQYGLYKFLLKNEPTFPCLFDLAVSFAGPSRMIDYYICEKVKATRKCSWIHFDVSKINIDKEMIIQLYKQFDRIFIVSETGKEIFDKAFPQFTDKTMLFHNVVLQEQILGMADNAPTFTDYFDGQRILTVGRLSEEKGQRVAIDALNILLNKGHKVKWYFVGDGDDRDCCEQLAAEYGISDKVEFLGLQTNPYGYMRDCDVYVQPSRHEGFCITLAEALCFGNPIVATNFTGAPEQLRNRENGIVVGMSSEEIAIGVISGLEMGLVEANTLSCDDDLSRLLDLLE